MATNVKTYDPARVQLVVGAFVIGGYAKGSMIKVERNEKDLWKIEVGATGEVTRVKTHDHTHKITINLTQGSKSNDVLTAVVQTDQATNAGVVPVILRDGNTGTAIIAAEGWVQSVPDLEYKDAASPNTWIIATSNVLPIVMGS